MAEHPSDDMLERFILGYLGAEDGASVHDHVRNCTLCAARYEDIRQYVQAMRDALKSLSERSGP